MSSPVPTFTPVEFIRYKYNHRLDYLQQRFPNWEHSQSTIDFLFNNIDDIKSNSYCMGQVEVENESYYSNWFEKIKLVRIEYDRQINEQFQFDKRHYPTFDFEQYKSMFESTSKIDDLTFDRKTDNKVLEEYYTTITRRDPFTFRQLKARMAYHEEYFTKKIIQRRKNLEMLDLWRQQYSAFNKLKIKKNWQIIFQAIVRKRKRIPVMTAITTIQHNLKHITTNKISPQKIAEWNAVTAHVLALVEEKMKVVEQVMKWKDIAAEFHNKNCNSDFESDCYGPGGPNFYNCHPQCEYEKYYLLL
jgi:hypothetical protein